MILIFLLNSLVIFAQKIHIIDSDQKNQIISFSTSSYNCIPLKLSEWKESQFEVLELNLNETVKFEEKKFNLLELTLLNQCYPFKKIRMIEVLAAKNDYFSEDGFLFLKINQVVYKERRVYNKFVDSFLYSVSSQYRLVKDLTELDLIVTDAYISHIRIYLKDE